MLRHNQGMNLQAQKHSKWYGLRYPVLGLLALDLTYQSLITWRQAHVIARAEPTLLLVAVLNQLTVYIVLMPAMRRFYAKANIGLRPARVFALLAMGLAFARIVPAGEYLVWRASLRHVKGAATATTQWLILYYTWMFGGLVALFFMWEMVTLIFYPNAHVDTLVGNLRFLPVVLSLGVCAVALATRSQWVRNFLRRAAYDKLGSQAVSPLGIIRERRLGRSELLPLTLACLFVWLIESFTLYLCLLAIGVEVPFAIVAFGFTFARLFSLIPLTPGGIGEIEAGTGLFFAAYGYHFGMVFTATILYRVITYWPALLLGLGVYTATSHEDIRTWAKDPVFAAQLHKRH